MEKQKLFKALPVAFIVFFVAASAFAATQNATSTSSILDKIAQFNQQSTLDFSVKISFLIAFVAGLLAIIAPCTVTILPAYFSYTFKERRNITRMTLVFFAGFSIVFMLMGVLAGIVGQQSLVLLQSGTIVVLGGILLVAMGILTISGRGLGSFMKFKKFGNDVPGVFLTGMAFALGWTACMGPVLAGILGIGVILHNIFYSVMLMFFYSLGNLAPLFILSVFYDRLNFSKMSFIKGSNINIVVSGKKYSFNTINLISGFLFIGLGAIMIFFNGTGIINTIDPLGTAVLFDSVQRSLISWKYANLAGFIAFSLFVIGAVVVIVRRRKRK